MTIVELQEIARANGYVILDWRDADLLRSSFPDLQAKDAALILEELSGRTGDWDECIDGDRTNALIRDIAEELDINLYGGDA